MHRQTELALYLIEDGAALHSDVGWETLAAQVGRLACMAELQRGWREGGANDDSLAPEHVLEAAERVVDLGDRALLEGRQNAPQSPFVGTLEALRSIEEAIEQNDQHALCRAVLVLDNSLAIHAAIADVASYDYAMAAEPAIARASGASKVASKRMGTILGQHDVPRELQLVIERYIVGLGDDDRFRRFYDWHEEWMDRSPVWQGFLEALRRSV